MSRQEEEEACALYMKVQKLGGATAVRERIRKGSLVPELSPEEIDNLHLAEAAAYEIEEDRKRPDYDPYAIDVSRTRAVFARSVEHAAAAKAAELLAQCDADPRWMN